MVTGGWRKDFVQIADDLRCVTGWIFRKHQTVQRVVLESRAEHLFAERAIDRQQPADTVEGETEAQLNGVETFRRDDDYKRKSFGTTRQTRTNQSDRGDSNLVLDLQLQNAAILAFVGVEEEKTAAAYDWRVNRDADTAWSLEVERKISNANIAAIFREGHQCLYADAVCDRVYWANGKPETDGNFTNNFAVFG